jgi:hypothetical protein
MSTETNRSGALPLWAVVPLTLTYALHMTANPVYNTKQWKQLRAQVLQEEPICHWCRKKPSCQADHVVELDRGGDPYDRTNIVGSCASCNARRGAIHVNKKTATRVQNRAKLSFLDKQTIPNPSSKIPSTSLNQQEPARTSGGSVISGRIEPRLVTPVPAGESFGPALTAWAKRVLNIELMEWQKRICNDALTVDADGDFVFREACISTARQNGKSLVMRAVAGFMATEYAAARREPQTIVIVANQKRRSMALFRDVVRDLENFDCKVRWQNGDERINFPDGSSISVVAASAHAHGLTASVLLVDEVWDIGPDVVFTALRPSQIAVKNPMMMLFSTAGDQGSTVLLQLREQGIAAIDSGQPTALYFAEWSLPPGVSLEDRSHWGWANPALGTTITAKALELAFDSPNRQAFIRGHLNLWVDSTNSYLPINLWNDRKSDRPAPATQWLTIDSSVDDSRYVGISTAFDDGRVIVSVAFVVESAAQMWEEVVRIMHDQTVKLAVTPSLEIHCPPDLRRRMQIVGYAELLKWTAACRAMIVEDRVNHTGDIALAEHLARAVAVKTGGSIVLSSQKSPGPIELARCAVWGIMLASKPVRSSRAAFAFG